MSPLIDGDVVYSSTHQPNPASALDVLAFVLAPNRLFATDPETSGEVTELLNSAKAEAVRRWCELRS